MFLFFDSLLQTGQGEVANEKEASSDSSEDSSEEEVSVEVKPLFAPNIKQKLDTETSKESDTSKFENPPPKKYKKYRFRIDWQWKHNK